MKKLILTIALSAFALSSVMADDAAKDKGCCPAGKDKTCCPAGKKDDKAGCDKEKSCGGCKEKKATSDKAKDSAKK